jgi:uncharacterized protein YlxP (DUF503 family)
MAMHVGVARVSLHLAEGSSLKDKRMVVRSVVHRARNRFNAAVSEVDSLDSVRTATLGIVVVSNDARHADEMLAKVVRFIESERLDADVGDVETEILAL